MVWAGAVNSNEFIGLEGNRQCKIKTITTGSGKPLANRGIYALPQGIYIYLRHDVSHIEHRC